MGVYTRVQTDGSSSLYLNRAVPTSGIHLHGDMLHTVVRATMEFFSTVDSGITTNRFSQDIQLIDSELSGALINATAGKPSIKRSVSISFRKAYQNIQKS
jgi:ATP-binding cassette subfamily C (CFTR/MRP) protein 1